MKKYIPFLLVLAGCATANYKEDKIKNRANFDLDCPATKIQVSQLGSESWGVTGCGRRATYLMSCGWRACGDPIMNSDVKSKK